DLAYAWPSAEVAVMRPQAVVEVLHRRELAEAVDHDARKAELVSEYAEAHVNPYVAAERGYVDDVIDPAHTRDVLVRGLALLRSKRAEGPPRKHGNVPL
ncbi:MAG: methylmalonyl-CoA carboxyltransferase, partial [Actinomycetota bacterium]|nr:methylmalonyl-CoA carboxyltransferase [Actinomycetota bacterium]